MRGAIGYGSMLSLLMILFASSGAGGQEPTGGFYPDRQRPMVEHSRSLTVRLTITNQQLKVVLEREGKTFATLSLPEEMAQVDSINFVANGKIAVLGHINGSVREVVVIDPASQSIIDTFYCYEPVVSPSKRFLAFIKFFPAHFVEGVTFEYLLYDFQKSPQANRPGNVPVSDLLNVGQALYPSTAKNRPGDNTDQPPSEIHLLESGTFFWSPDGDRVAFADSYHGIVRLVVARLYGVEPVVQVTERELRKSDICNSQKDLDSCSFAVSSIEFTDGGVKLGLRPLNFAVGITREIDLTF